MSTETIGKLLHLTFCCFYDFFFLYLRNVRDYKEAVAGAKLEGLMIKVKGS